MRDMSYQQRAVYVMNSYLDDFTASELSAYADKAYGGEKFDVKEVAPVRAVDENTYCLELWHGPTCAFKDMGHNAQKFSIDIHYRKQIAFSLRNDFNHFT